MAKNETASESKVLITISEKILHEEKKATENFEKPKFRLVVKIPFGKYKKIGQIIINADEIKEIIDSGNVRYCCKSSI